MYILIEEYDGESSAQIMNPAIGVKAVGITAAAALGTLILNNPDMFPDLIIERYSYIPKDEKRRTR